MKVSRRSETFHKLIEDNKDIYCFCIIRTFQIRTIKKFTHFAKILKFDLRYVVPIIDETIERNWNEIKKC